MHYSSPLKPEPSSARQEWLGMRGLNKRDSSETTIVPCASEKKLSGENDPLYPKTFSQRRFYRNFSSSYESQLPQKLAESINSDNVAQFNITLPLCNRQLSKNLVLHLLLRGVINILKAYLSAIDRFLSLEKTVLFCASSVPEPVATHLLSAIENATPDCMKKASDIFGNNTL